LISILRVWGDGVPVVAQPTASISGSISAIFLIGFSFLPGLLWAVFL